MRIYNSLTRIVEEVKPIRKGKIGIYTCGPTVYDYASIGNFRTYTTSDFLVRAFKYFGFEVDFIMNLTDVGHLTGDNLGDADTGEDRIEKSAKKEGKNAWEIAEFYINAFLKDFEKLNLVKPKLFARATEHIIEQINLIKKLEQKGLTYKTSDGIYFDTKRFESTGKKYGVLSNLDSIKEGARVEPNPEKKNPRDFALWKFSPKKKKRHMEWDSPWGVGFPGWHIECSAMSMKYLGETFDIHVGGEDLRSTHHPNEMAQSEGATGKPFVNYWVHGAFLKVDGKRMGKSLGNAYTLSQIEERGFDSLALRYFYMTGHYRDILNFNWDALSASQKALTKLKNLVGTYKEGGKTKRTSLSSEKLAKVENYRARFEEYISDDLKIPQALALTWEVVKSNIPNEDKLDLVLSFDEVFGLNLGKIDAPPKNVANEVLELLKKRNELRKAGDFEQADAIRDRLKREFNYEVHDDPV